MLQVRIELTTSASPAHILLYKYRALTDCATGAPAPHFRSLATRPTQGRPPAGSERSPRVPRCPRAPRRSRFLCHPARGPKARRALCSRKRRRLLPGTHRCTRSGDPDGPPRTALHAQGWPVAGGGRRTEAAPRLSSPPSPPPRGVPTPEDARGRQRARAGLPAAAE